MNEKKAEAAKAVMSLWCVDDDTKLDAVELIMGGCDLGTVVRTVESIQDAQGMLCHIRWQMDNRKRLAKYREEHPDTKFVDE